jgi:hypothetical protein
VLNRARTGDSTVEFSDDNGVVSTSCSTVPAGIVSSRTVIVGAGGGGVGALGSPSAVGTAAGGGASGAGTDPVAGFGGLGRAVLVVRRGVAGVATAGGDAVTPVAAAAVRRSA